MAEDFESDQRELAQLWKKARKDGCMPPWQQAKVFGLKEAWQAMHGDMTHGQATWIIKWGGTDYPKPIWLLTPR